ncbi:MAG: transpeptidase family protein [Tannerella sp.]|jgi:cell division protein FtsI (penicillin-binding protein 3)|nr:transpeptidase family protein [Tannerella sp.]
MEEEDKTLEDATHKTTRTLLIRYFLVVLLLSPIIIGIPAFTFKISFVEKERWTEEAKKYKLPDRLINPNRGNIYSTDGKLMATSMPRYYLYMDFRADGFSKDSFLHSRNNGIDSLSYYLSRKLGGRTAAGFKAHLIKGLNSKSRQYPVYEIRVSYADLKEIRQFPFFRYGRNRSGLYEKEMVQRQKLFDRMASRTIGDIYNEIETGGLSKGKNGLELHYDSLLRGQPGLKSFWRVGRQWTNVTDVEPVDGYDIFTTIDIRIQDYTEKALADKLRELDADLGIAIVMEVRTGEIKAISNLERAGAGRYVESKNHAVADEIEPGSTFKIASMMVALDDKVCTPDDIVDANKGSFAIGNRWIRDHNYNTGGYQQISVAEAIWYSSNVGVAKVILKGYEKNPEKFIEGLNRIGINADLNPEIPGAGRTKINSPADRSWSRTSLPWMSFGYEVQVPPIQTLAFYNAIANDGKLIRPIFTKEIQKDGKTIRRFSTETLRSSICSRETLKIIREMMVDVVHKGTGRNFHSESVTFAGKTGTARIASGGRYSDTHNLSFCGYFPAEQPQYTCLVVIRRPRIGTPSGTMPGSVFKTIAEKVYSHQTKIDLRSATVDSAAVRLPAVKNGETEALRYVLNELKIKNNAKQIKTAYAGYHHKPETEQVELSALTMHEGQVPNVTGMGAKDAVYTLEKSGMRVGFSGRGQVVSQSISPGQPIVKGQSIALVLR